MASILSSFYTDKSSRCRLPIEPAPTLTASPRVALVNCLLSPNEYTQADRVVAFMLKYYGTNIGSALDEPLHTATTKDHFALITGWIQGSPYVITDIRLRMLTPRELYDAQDFPHDYIIDRGHDGRIFTQAEQVRMCGNSVNPVSATAFLAVNAPWLAIKKMVA
jgi:DNA (cytosine-5)-methyltransferase 1